LKVQKSLDKHPFDCYETKPEKTLESFKKKRGLKNPATLAYSFHNLLFYAIVYAGTNTKNMIKAPVSSFAFS